MVQRRRGDIFALGKLPRRLFLKSVLIYVDFISYVSVFCMFVVFDMGRRMISPGPGEGAHPCLGEGYLDVLVGEGILITCLFDGISILLSIVLLFCLTFSYSSPLSQSLSISRTKSYPDPTSNCLRQEEHVTCASPSVVS